MQILVCCIDRLKPQCEAGADEIAADAGNPAVQSAHAMQVQMADQLPQLHAVARQLYQHWVKGLVD